MKLLLLSDVADLGKKGEVVEVKEGFARNFLIPKGLVKVANEAIENQAAREQQKQENKKQKEVEKNQELAQKINKLTLTFKEKAAAKNKIFGSIDEKTIAADLSKKLGVKVSAKQIILEKHIKEIGKHEANINLGSNITAKLKIDLSAK